MELQIIGGIGEKCSIYYICCNNKLHYVIKIQKITVKNRIGLAFYTINYSKIDISEFDIFKILVYYVSCF